MRCGPHQFQRDVVNPRGHRDKVPPRATVPRRNETNHTPLYLPSPSVRRHAIFVKEGINCLHTKAFRKTKNSSTLFAFTRCGPHQFQRDVVNPRGHRDKAPPRATVPRRNETNHTPLYLPSLSVRRYTIIDNYSMHKLCARKSKQTGDDD